jgi:CubicO group peptidase (beta-lactamase class C family)
MKHLVRSCLPLLAAWLAPICAAQPSPPHFADIVQPYVDQGRFAGAIGVVVSRDGVLAYPIVGYADVEAKKPMRHDTMFWLASTSKVFQGTALMMLVDEGKVKLDDSVGEYLPPFKAARLRAITVRMLLNHTNGLSYSDPMQPERTDCCALQDLVQKFASRPLMFEPGSRFGYSNAGPDTASRIVEVVSGKDFESFLAERLLKPLGMIDTTYFPDEQQLSRLAVTYMTSPDGKLVRAPNEVFLTTPYGDRKVRHAPGGGLFSTGEDLAKFARMFLRRGELDGRRYLSETSVAEMTRDQVPAALAASVPQPPGGLDLPVSYGLCWGVTPHGAFFHVGVTMTDIRVDPAHGFATIVLPQHAPDPTAFEIYFTLGDAAVKNVDVNEH